MRSKTVAETDQKSRHYLKLIGALLFLIAAGWFLLRTFQSDVPKPYVKPFTSLGSLAADETVTLIGRHGSIVIVSEIPDPKSPSTDAMVRSIKMVAVEVDGFKEAMQHKGRFTYLPELRLVRPSDAIKTVWPVGEFRKLLARLPDNATLVAFCGLPGQLSESEQRMLQSRAGKLVIVGGVVPEVKPLVERRIAHLAVAAKVPVPPAKDAAPEAPHQWVQRVYAVLKP